MKGECISVQISLWPTSSRMRTCNRCVVRVGIDHIVVSATIATTYCTTTTVISIFAITTTCVLTIVVRNLLDEGTE